MAKPGWEQEMVLIPDSNFFDSMPEDEPADFPAKFLLESPAGLRGDSETAGLRRLIDGKALPTRRVSATMENGPANGSKRLAAAPRASL
jgi:hypothetical protein